MNRKNEQPYSLETNTTTKDDLVANEKEIAETKLAIAELDRAKAEKDKDIADAIERRTKEIEKEAADNTIKEGAVVAKKKTGALEKNKNTLARLGKAGKTRAANTAVVAAAAQEAVGTPAKRRILEKEKIAPDASVSDPVEPSKADTAPKAPSVPPAPSAPPRAEDQAERLAEKYSKEGLGAITAKLSALPAFQALPEGQKLLVMQGVSDRLYEHVKTEGARKFQAEHAKSGFFGKVWKGATKTYRTVGHEKAALSAVTGAQSDAFVTKIAPELIQVFSQSGLEAYLADDGKSVITKYSALAEDSDLAKGIPAEASKKYDIAASALARIPDDWNKPSATKKEKEEYQKANMEFDAAASAYMAIVAKDAMYRGVENPAAYAAEAGLRSDVSIRTMRLLAAHPDVLKTISTISKTSAWYKGLKDTAVERLGMAAGSTAMNVGRVGRYATTAVYGVGSTMSLAAAPIAAAVIGGFRGRARAKESLRERDRLARAGVKQEGQTAHRMSDVNRKVRQLNETKEFLDNASSPIERQKALARLATYADFIQAKLELGQVNFGEERGRFTRQYELMRSLHESRVALALGEREGDVGVISDEVFRNRIESFGTLVQETTSDARKREVFVKTLKGIGFGAVAGSIGPAVRYFGEHLGWYPHSSSSHSVIPKHAKMTPSPIAHDSDQVRFDKALSEKLAHAKLAASDSVRVDTVRAPDTTKVLEDTTLGNTPAPMVNAPDVTTPSGNLAEVEFSSKGAEQTLLDFRHSADFSKLPPDQQKFFEGNIAKIARQLQSYRPDAADGKESLTVGAGSHFGVTEDGKIFITDTLNGGKTTVLGHFDNGEFTADADPADLHYIHAGEHVRNLGKVPKKTVADLGLNTNETKDISGSVDTKIAGPEGVGPVANGEEYAKMLEAEQPAASPVSYEEITPEQQEALGMYKDLGDQDIDPAYVSFADKDAYVMEPDLTPGKIEHIEHVADRMSLHQINRFFSYFNEYGVEISGPNSMLWQSYQYAPMRSILSMDIHQFQPSIRPFIKHMRALANNYPEIDRSLPLVEFMKKGYRFKTEMRELGKIMYQ